MIEYWPTKEWHRKRPEAVGIDTGNLSALEQEIKKNYRSINSVLIIRKGYLAFERYYNKTGQNDIHLVASVTKSFISALIGIAIDQGYIQGVHTKILDFFPEYPQAKADPLKRELTIEHLLTMTAGFQWRTGAHLHELYIDRVRRSKDWVGFILGLPVRERAFGTFQYNSGCSHLLSAIITRSTGQCAQEFAGDSLFDPLGITRPAANIQNNFSQTDVFRNTAGGWPKDPQGNSIGGWGLVLKPEDMARFGYLYLNHGRWDNRQVISKSWIDASVMQYTPGYGYQWWVRDIHGTFVYSAVGQGGQHIICVPDKELVVVIASRMGSRFRDRWLLLQDFILPAVT